MRWVRDLDIAMVLLPPHSAVCDGGLSVGVRAGEGPRCPTFMSALIPTYDLLADRERRVLRPTCAFCNVSPYRILVVIKSAYAKLHS